jgi:N-acetylglutamate synthase-like GNAT family acetyltransferase
MIRDCSEADIETMNAIINDAARAYRGVIPADCWHEPYMTRSELLAEIASGARFAGWEEGGTLVGIMGLQRVRDVTLIRHAYVRMAHQGHGIAGELIKWLTARVNGPLLVGTWAAAVWAIRFYERHGFRPVSLEEKDRLLTNYWNIPARQREASVVLVRSAPSQ